MAPVILTDVGKCMPTQHNTQSKLEEKKEEKEEIISKDI